MLFNDVRGTVLLRSAALLWALIMVGAGAGSAKAQTAWFNTDNGVVEELHRVDTTTNTLIGGAGPQVVNGYAVLATSTRVYVANYNANTLTVVDAATSTLVTTVLGMSQPLGLALSPDGSRLFVANQGDNTVSIIATATNAVVGTLTGGSAPSSVAISPNGTTIYIANEGSNDVTARTIATDTLLATYTGFIGPRQIILSADGTKAYVPNSNSATQGVSVLTLAGGAVMNVATGKFPWGIARSPDGSAIYVANPQSDTVSRILTANNAVTTVASGVSPLGVSTTPDGSKLYVINQGGNSIGVYNATNMALLTTIAVGNNPKAVGQFIAPAVAPVVVAAVPTLSEWAMILFGLALAGGAVLYIQGRRLAA